MISQKKKKRSSLEFLRTKGQGFSNRNHKFKHFFRLKTGDLQKEKKGLKVFTGLLKDFPAEITNLNIFSGRKRVISKKAPIWGLGLHFSSPEPVNFFGAESSLGGHKESFGGTRPRNAPPWRRV